MWTFYWDDVTLPFADPPSKLCPTVTILEHLAERGEDFTWNYRGLVGIVPVEVIHNALAEWAAYKQNRHLREKVPVAVGRFTWGQTLSVKQAGELRRGSPSTEPASGGKAGQ